MLTLVLALAGCSSSALSKPAAAPNPIVTPSPTPSHLDERAACQIITPTIQDATIVMTDFAAHNGGSTVDLPTLDASVTKLADTRLHGPDDLAKPLTDVLTPLQTLQEGLEDHAAVTIQTLQFSFVAAKLLDTCRPFMS